MCLRSIMAGVVVLSSTVGMTATSTAATEREIFSAKHKKASAWGRLDEDKEGNLYGVMPSGSAHGQGFVFQLTLQDGFWQEQNIYAFDWPYGRYPLAGVLVDDGILWGTAGAGGSADAGTIFFLTQQNGRWNPTLVHEFTGTDGEAPYNYLYKDSTSGYIFGTTVAGGTYNCGTVFSVSPSGTFSTIYNFEGGSDACTPHTALREGPQKGTLVGGASGGNNDAGTIFLLNSNGGSWSESVIYAFTGGMDGASPSDIGVDKAGNVFGTTFGGGAYGFGAVFELMLKGRKWHQSVLHSFGTDYDGELPVGIQLVRGTNAIYGTTQGGGYAGEGTLFSLTPNGDDWDYVRLYDFGGLDAHPIARPILDTKSGKLYGVTVKGGTNGSGGVYEITP